ncbi:acyltransferase family protein [Aeromonas veronii]|uniref:acyltransferase family protein n=1 Tax=Aeromonas veronii TaxID=654 RepID=UPI003D1F4E3D
MSNLKYRSDIDGLRALAVLSVVIFHINKSWLPGGFIGVDIFFVISGFLITGIIYKEILEKEFSFANFYNRRIKRILPVFFFVVSVTTLISSLVMMPSEFLYYMKSVGSTLFFASNMFFGYATDYFAPNTAEYPLLHTWSLAVEEQYYIIFPVVLLLLMKFLSGYKHIITALLIVAGVSISISCILPHYPDYLKYNYYWLPSRAYELMIGSIAAIAIKDNKTAPENGWILSSIGMAMVIASLAFIKETAEFPGMFAVIPCIGTALVLVSGGQGSSLVTRVLSLKTIVFIGLISYSLYLWHWPILAIMRYVSNDGTLTNLQIIIAVVLMFSLSWFSWRFIETPVRKSKMGVLKSSICFYLIPTVILGTLSYGAIKNEGYPQRFGSKNEQMTQESTYMVTPFCHNLEFNGCIFGDISKKPNTYMIGDSHAGHYSPMFDEIGKARGFSFIAKTVDACYPLLDINGEYPSENKPFYTELCPQLIKKASVEYKQYKNIVFAGVWSEHYRLNPKMQVWLENEIATLTKEGHNVFIVEQSPMFKPNVYEHAFRQRFGLLNISKIIGNSSDISDLRVDVDRSTNDLLRSTVAKYKNAYFIQPMTTLGEDNKKLPFFDGKLVYRDSGHMNEYGSRSIGKHVAHEMPVFDLITDTSK